MRRKPLMAALASATDGSPELDARIAVAIDARPDWARNDQRKLTICQSKWLDGPAGISVALGKHGPSVEFLPYTRSVDAALSLVPATYSWHMSTGPHIPGTSCHMCPVGPDNCGIADPRTTDGYSRNSPALALCIAALKARRIA